MRYSAMVFVLVWIVSLGGCATVQVSQDYDPNADLSHYGSWAWQYPAQVPTGDIRIDNPLLIRRIRTAMENHMIHRQLPLVQRQPDLYMVYHLAIERKIRSDVYTSSVGVGSYYHPWYGGIGTESRIWEYDENRLTIDILDANTEDLLWRGVGVYRLKTYKSPEAAAIAAQETVDKILSQFPPPSQ